MHREITFLRRPERCCWPGGVAAAPLVAAAAAAPLCPAVGYIDSTLYSDQTGSPPSSTPGEQHECHRLEAVQPLVGVGVLNWGRGMLDFTPSRHSNSARFRVDRRQDSMRSCAPATKKQRSLLSLSVF
jgi:hypothetical protein